MFTDCRQYTKLVHRSRRHMNRHFLCDSQRKTCFLWCHEGHIETDILNCLRSAPFLREAPSCQKHAYDFACPNPKLCTTYLEQEVAGCLSVNTPNQQLLAQVLVAKEEPRRCQQSHGHNSDEWTLPEPIQFICQSFLFVKIEINNHNKNKRH